MIATQVVWTNEERKLAKAGYAYHANESRKGLKPLVRCLVGKTRDDIVFDHDAYITHKKMGII